MAKVYASPDEEVPPPVVDYRNYDYEKEEAAEDAYIEKLREWAKSYASKPDDLIGEMIYHGVADGKAQYMVISAKPLELIHLKLGDGYSAGAIWERGLRITDVRDMVKRRKALDLAFATKLERQKQSTTA